MRTRHRSKSPLLPGAFQSLRPHRPGQQRPDLRAQGGQTLALASSLEFARGSWARPEIRDEGLGSTALAPLSTSIVRSAPVPPHRGQDQPGGTAATWAATGRATSGAAAAVISGLSSRRRAPPSAPRGRRLRALGGTGGIGADLTTEEPLAIGDDRSDADVSQQASEGLDSVAARMEWRWINLPGAALRCVRPRTRDRASCRILIPGLRRNAQQLRVRSPRRWSADAPRCSPPNLWSRWRNSNKVPALVAAVLVGGLSACGSDDTADRQAADSGMRPTGTSSTPTESKQPAPAKEPKPAPTRDCPGALEVGSSLGVGEGLEGGELSRNPGDLACNYHAPDGSEVTIVLGSGGNVEAAANAFRGQLKTLREAGTLVREVDNRPDYFGYATVNDGSTASLPNTVNVTVMSKDMKQMCIVWARLPEGVSRGFVEDTYDGSLDLAQSMCGRA